MEKRTQQRHLDYIVDLEHFSFIFRPRTNDTDIIQFRRFDYTPENMKVVIDQIRNTIPKPKGNCVPTTFLLTYLVKTQELVSYSGLDRGGVNHWFLIDRGNKEVYDITKDQYSKAELASIYENAKPKPYYGFQSQPAARFFDLLMKIQPTAKRFFVDEIITRKKRYESDFFSQKTNMDYLYNLGVFGTFKK